MTEPNTRPVPDRPDSMEQSRVAAQSSSQAVNPTKTSDDQDEPIAATTPPPASQGSMRTGVAHTNQLHSPPPTTLRQDGTAHAEKAKQQEIDNKDSVAELCAVIQRMQLELNEARTTTAHFKLQYNMLRMDSVEMQNRMLVELDMAQREIEVLQAAEERRKHELLSPTLAQAEATTANAIIINELSQERAALLEERDDLNRLLLQAQREIEKKDGLLAGQDELIERLRGRIRMNREHVNGLLDNIFENTAASPAAWLATPMRRPNSQYATPRSNLPQRDIMQPTSQPRENHNFDALLLADQFISQESTTGRQPPSTPSRSSAKRQHGGHTRGVHSLSSLPSTPRRQIIPTSRLLQTPPQQSSAIAEPPSSTFRSKMSSIGRPPKFSRAGTTTISTSAPRRLSSDSTIEAASDVEDTGTPSRRQKRDDLSVRRTPTKAPEQQLVPHHSSPQLQQQSRPAVEDSIVPESQASQAAIDMLRRTPVKSGGSFSAINNSMSAPAKSAGTTGNSRRKDFSQTKLTGRIAKPGSILGSAQGEAEKEKRRMASFSADASSGSPSKKSRTGGGLGQQQQQQLQQHIGLGIGMEDASGSGLSR